MKKKPHASRLEQLYEEIQAEIERRIVNGSSRLGDAIAKRYGEKPSR